MIIIREWIAKNKIHIRRRLVIVLTALILTGGFAVREIAVLAKSENLKENSFRYIDGEPVPLMRGYSDTHPDQWKKIDGHWISNDGSVIEGARMKGMDVSAWNKTIDWAKAKADGIDFAIIRCGFSTDKESYDDLYWERNASECERLGIPYGVYLYSYAETVEEAKSEADHTIRLLKEHKPTFPVYYDLEDECVFNTGTANIAKMAKAYLDRVQSAGYRVGIYSSLYWWNNYLTDPVYDNTAWSRWIAQWNSSCTYTGIYDLWQCTNVGEVDGITGNVDLDFMMRSPAFLKSDTVCYRACTEGKGWGSIVTGGKTAGSTKKGKAVQAIKIRILNTDKKGDVIYNTRIVGEGWTGEKKKMAKAGSVGAGKVMDAVKIDLTGELKETYDIYYRVFVSDFGWLGWAKNGETAGTRYYQKQVEAFQIKVIKKGKAAPGSTIGAYRQAKVKYRTCSGSKGWSSYVFDGSRSGKCTKKARLTAIRISAPEPSMNRYLHYRTRFENYGWQRWVKGSASSGRCGTKKRMEAIQIRLTGKLKTQYDVYYRVFIYDYGWLGWAKNGKNAGAGGKPIAAIRVRFVKKGGKAPGNTNRPYVKAN